MEYQTNAAGLAGLILLFVGLVFVVVGIIISVIFKVKTKRCTDTVTAEVVENIKVKSSGENHRTSTTYKPVFSFIYTGKNYKFSSSTSANPPVFDVGEKVLLKINPNNPADFYAEKDRTMKILSIIFTGLGALLTVIGAVLLIVLK